MSCLNQCAHRPCVSGIKSKTYLPRQPLQAGPENHFPFSEKKLADYVWEHDVILAEQNSGILLRILSVQIKTSQDRALAFCITQSCPVPGAAMWY